MTATVLRYVLHTCDATVGCPSLYRGRDTLNATEARQDAAEAGWSHPRGEGTQQDYCPEHTRTRGGA
jgi:hypothetical protein